MSGKSFHGDAGNDFFAALEQRHLAAGDERVVVVGDVADGVALAGLPRILPFAFGRIVFRTRKSWHDLAVFADRVPTAVVEMQMRVNDDVDVFGDDACDG